MQQFFIISLIFVSLSVSGQAKGLPYGHKQEQQQERRDKETRKPNMAPNRLRKIQEIKTAYITKKLELNAAQADKFWPLYNKYQAEMFEVQTQIRLNNSPSQTNGKDQVQNELLLDQRKINIRAHYQNEFLKILPPEKVSLIYKSEKEFQDEIIKQMRERRNSQPD